MQNGTWGVILKKVSCNIYYQLLISAMKGITKDCLSLQYEKSMQAIHYNSSVLAVRLLHLQNNDCI